MLNLVFFKVVRSYAKFWQMIGRGTRLCPDVFGPNKPKEYFLIFDVCQNFEFFEINKDGKDAKIVKPLTQQIFEARLQVSRLLAETGELENIEMSNKILDILHYAIRNLDCSRFQVDMNLRYVDDFKEREKWNNLTADSVHIIEEYLSELPTPELINEIARRFDLMMLKLQIANLLQKGKEKNYQEALMIIADELSKKYTIPQVLSSKELIENMKDPDFYKNLSQNRIENIRVEIRGLINFIDTQSKQSIYTDIEDSELEITLGEPISTYESNIIYKKRVERFIRENKNNITISKLSTNNPITEQEIKVLEQIIFDGEERGTAEKFNDEYGEQPLGKFVRTILFDQCF